MDDQRRDLERSAASGDDEAAGRLLQLRIRTGEVTRKGAELAALLGHEGARLAVGAPAAHNHRAKLEAHEAGPFMRDQTWLRAIAWSVRPRPDLAARACAAIVADALNQVPPPKSAALLPSGIEPLLASMDVVAVAGSPADMAARPEHSLIAERLAMLWRGSMRIAHSVAPTFRLSVRRGGRRRLPLALNAIFEVYDNGEWRLDGLARLEEERLRQPRDQRHASRIFEWFGESVLAGVRSGGGAFPRAAIRDELCDVVLATGRDRSLERLGDRRLGAVAQAMLSTAEIGEALAPAWHWTRDGLRDFVLNCHRETARTWGSA